MEKRRRGMFQAEGTSYEKPFDRKKDYRARSLRSWEKQLTKETSKVCRNHTIFVD